MAKTKTAKPLSPKKLDTLIGQMWHTKASGVQINMMDISKIYKAATEAYNGYFANCVKTGMSSVADAEALAALNDSIELSIQTYRLN